MGSSLQRLGKGVESHHCVLHTPTLDGHPRERGSVERPLGTVGPMSSDARACDKVPRGGEVGDDEVLRLFADEDRGRARQFDW